MNLLVIEVRQLTRAGLFSGEFSTAWIKINEEKLYCATYEDEAILQLPKFFGGISQQFSTTDDRFWSSYNVSTTTRQLNYGSRRYFICPISRLDCLKLIYDGQNLCSIDAYRGRSSRPFTLRAFQYEQRRRRLFKQDGTQRLTTLQKERLIAAMAKHPERYRSDASVQNFLHNLERAQARIEAKTKWESRALSTTKALDLARGMNQYDIYERARADGLDSFPSIKVEQFERPWAEGEIGDFPELDIKVLIKRFNLDEHEFSALRLGWPEETTDRSLVYMFVDGRSNRPPRCSMIFEGLETKTLVRQDIRILSNSRTSKSRYFLCPVTHIRCEKLYYRNGFFASAEAQRLRAPRKSKGRSSKL